MRAKPVTTNSYSLIAYHEVSDTAPVHTFNTETAEEILLAAKYGDTSSRSADLPTASTLWSLAVCAGSNISLLYRSSNYRPNPMLH